MGLATWFNVLESLSNLHVFVVSLHLLLYPLCSYSSHYLSLQPDIFNYSRYADGKIFSLFFILPIHQSTQYPLHQQHFHPQFLKIKLLNIELPHIDQ
jgi:hypothetical protein